MSTLCKNHKDGCNGVTDGSIDGQLTLCDGCKDENWERMQTEIKQLLESLIPEIADDDQPGMQVTVATKDGEDWVYQTVDNSYSGACYFKPHWAVIYLYRNSDCTELARTAVVELADLVSAHEAWEANNLKPGFV